VHDENKFNNKLKGSLLSSCQ